MDLSFIIGVIGNIISILVFASPIGTFKRVVKNRSTENFKGLPYVCTLLSTSLWTYYGLLKPGGLLVVTVNGVGAIMEAVYVSLFLVFAPKDKRVKMVKLVGILNVGFLGGVILITLLAIHGRGRLNVIGFLCAGLTLGMYASPMASMRTVIVTKTVEFMPFSLSFFLFLNGGVWSVYALLVKDFFIGVPNAIGFVLGSVQLVLYMIYRNNDSESRDKEEKMEEEGSKHLVQGASDIEMQGNDEDEAKKTHSLPKGRSLPKTLIARQQSIQKRTLKSNSLNSYELHSLQNQTEDDLADRNGYTNP